MIVTPINVYKRYYYPKTGLYSEGWPVYPVWLPTGYAKSYYDKAVPYPIDRTPWKPGQFKITEWNQSRSTGLPSTGGNGLLRVSQQNTPTSNQYHYEFDGPLAGYTGLPDKAPYKAIDLAYDSNQDALALQRAMAKVGGSELELQVEFGELRETIGMLRDPVRSLRDFFLKKNAKNLTAFNSLLISKKTVRDARKRSRQAGLDAAKAASDTWLEMRYGLRPLIGSIQSVADYLKKEVDRKFDPTVIRRKSFKVEQTISRRDSQVYIYDFYKFFRWTAYQETIMRSRAVVYYRLSAEPTVSEELGLTLRFLPETAWELTRLSFVADWIFSIGPWLGSLRFKPGIIILGNTVSTTHHAEGTRTVSVRPFGEAINAPVALEGSVGTYEFSASKYRRRVNVEVPLTPLFRGSQGLNWLKAIDLAALTLQPLLKGIRR